MQGNYPSGPSYAEKLSVNYLAALLSAQSHTTFILDIVRRAGVSLFDDAQATSSQLPSLYKPMRGQQARSHEESDGGFGMPFDDQGTGVSNSTLFYPGTVARIASSTDVHEFTEGGSPTRRSGTFGSV